MQEKEDVFSIIGSIATLIIGCAAVISLIFANFDNMTPTSTPIINEGLKIENTSLEEKEAIDIDKHVADNYNEEMSLLEQYCEYNEDVIGMIRIKDSVLYHPIMRSEYQEDFYLNHDLNKEYNSHGVPFVSLESKLNKEGNTVIYGHNIRLKTRDVFCDLAYYSDLDYYKEHPVIEIFTDEGVSKYLIFAYYLVDLSDTDAFLYYESSHFLSMKKFESYMQNVRIRNYLDVPCELQIDDCYITLSSCSNEMHGAGTNRMVVMAKKIEDGEDYESYVDKATLKNSPLMPEKLR